MTAAVGAGSQGARTLLVEQPSKALLTVAEHARIARVQPPRRPYRGRLADASLQELRASLARLRPLIRILVWVRRPRR